MMPIGGSSFFSIFSFGSTFSVFSGGAASLGTSAGSFTNILLVIEKTYSERNGEII